MKTLTNILILLIVALNSYSQTQIQGKITDKKGDPLTGVNIYFKGTYFGTSSDSLGNFNLKADLEQTGRLVVSFIGYENYEQDIEPRAVITGFSIKLQEDENQLNAVTITAGSFDASDEAKAVTLRPLDIVTVASGEGDIYGALNTMPGTQLVGEEGKLFVRGGEGYEVKTYIDGMLVNSPYRSTMPDVPARGRFSPFMFSGTTFSTGGYSAEYGQALSSALILKTNALPEKDVSSINLYSVGLGASHTKRWDRTSVTLNLDYMNLSPYYEVCKQDIDWEKAPVTYSSTMLFRQKVGESGLIKSFVSGSYEDCRLNYPNIEHGGIQMINLKNQNYYVNTVYNDMISANWQLLAGISYNHDIEQIDIDNDRVETFEDNYQLRIKLTQTIFNSLAIKYGAETIISDYKQDYFVATEEYTYNTNFNENYLAAFIEPELQLSKHFALRPGTRLEYSKLSNEFFLQPRISLACRLTARSQFSFAFGKFSQAAQNDYRKFNNELKAERAKHYILNYQYVKNERTFRIEAYYKKYDNLIKYDSLNLPIKDTYNNNGNGFAKGIDIFWRDSKTFTNVDYYFSYSFMDTERNYRNYTEAAPPIYTSTHNFSAVYKHWVSKISSQIGLTYSFASGRPYYNPNNLNFMTDRTPPLHDVSVNLSHLTTFFDKPLIIHASVSNLLGYDKVYGYRYPVNPNDELYNEGHAVKPSAKRFFLLVFMLSL